MTDKPRWGRSERGIVYHLVGNAWSTYFDFYYPQCWRQAARDPLILTRFPKDYTPSEEERCLRCRKMAEAAK